MRNYLGVYGFLVILCAIVKLVGLADWPWWNVFLTPAIAAWLILKYK